MLKTLSIIPLSLVVLTSTAFARDPYFVRYPMLNDKVADFATAFINNLLPEVSSSQVRFDFTEGTDGVKKTDMAFGQIQGTYQGVANVPNSNDAANIVMDFRVNLELAPQNPSIKSREYAIHLRADGNIDNSGSFMNFFMGTLSPECIEDDHVNEKSILGDVCRAFVEKQIDSSKSNIDNAYDILSLWKVKFLEGLDKIQHREIVPIKAEFIAYIDQRIQLTKSSSSVNLSVNLENLVKDYGVVARNFLKESKLIDYSLNSVDVHMDDKEIQFSAHVVKLHVVSSINKYMELASSLTSIIESRENGATIGKAIRDGQAMSRREIFGQASALDKASAALTGGMMSIFGSKNPEPVQQPAAGGRDLGLD